MGNRECGWERRTVHVDNWPNLVALFDLVALIGRRQMARKQLQSPTRTVDPVMLLARVELVGASLKHMKTPSEANACGGKWLRERAPRGARFSWCCCWRRSKVPFLDPTQTRRKKPVGNC